MRRFAHRAGGLRQESHGVFRLLTGLLLVLLWACAGCGGGGDEQAEPAAGGNRMVPQGVEQAADSTIAETAAEPAAETAAAPAEQPAVGTAAETQPEPVAASAPDTAPETVPEPQAQPQKQPAGGNLATGGEYSLQLGSFRARTNAEARAQLVRDTGYAPAIVTVVVGETTYHRVVIRNLADRATAERVGQELKDLLGIDYLVKQSG